MTRPLLHPLTLGSLAILVLNDHVLKRVFPSFLTGKLSDFAGLFLLPLVLTAGFLAVSKRLGRAPEPRLANGALLVSVGATMLGFALVELVAPAETAFRYGLGALQWPFRVLFSAVAGGAIPSLAPVRATADATDLVALPMGLLSLSVGWQREHRKTEALRSRLRASVLGLLLGTAFVFAAAGEANATTSPAQDPPACFARGAYTHNGFYLSGGLGLGAIFVDSEASISNGFQQSLPSSASGTLFPLIDLAIGGTLPNPLLVIGARFVRADAVEPAIHTLDESFSIQYFRIGFSELSLFGSYYLDPHVGTHIGGSVGYFSLYVGETQDVLGDSQYGGSHDQTGVGLSVEGGQDFWVMKEVSLGLTLRLAFAALSHDSNSTLVFAPTLLGNILFH